MKVKPVNWKMAICPGHTLTRPFAPVKRPCGLLYGARLPGHFSQAQLEGFLDRTVEGRGQP